jgi:hypothetical protein
VEARSLGGPLDPILRVFDAAGKVLAEVDDSANGRDAELTLDPPADGTYRIEVRDLSRHGGDRYYYRLTATGLDPDFRLTLGEGQFVVTPGKPASVSVTIERKNDFSEPIELRVADLPDGVEAAPARSEPKGESSSKVSLELTSKRTTSASFPIRVVGRTLGTPPKERTARIPIPGFDRFLTQAWVTVLKPALDVPSSKGTSEK